jgi:hypothetical protein
MTFDAHKQCTRPSTVRAGRPNSFDEIVDQKTWTCPGCRQPRPATAAPYWDYRSKHYVCGDCINPASVIKP